MILIRTLLFAWLINNIIVMTCHSSETTAVTTTEFWNFIPSFHNYALVILIEYSEYRHYDVYVVIIEEI